MKMTTNKNTEKSPKRELFARHSNRESYFRKGVSLRSPVVITQVQPENIPTELKNHPFWAVWSGTITEDGGFSKIPRNAKGHHLSVNSKKGWLTFPQALAAYEAGGWMGLGILFTPEDPFIGVEIDFLLDDLDDDATPDDYRNLVAALEIMKSLNTYTELSSLGKGFQCIASSSSGFQLDASKVEGIEFYTENQFMPITGGQIGRCTAINKNCVKKFRMLHQKYILERTQAPGPINNSVLSQEESK